MKMINRWDKKELDKLLLSEKGVEIECISENAARNLRFALYKRMKEPKFRISVYGVTVSLIPLVKEQIVSVKLF